MGSDAAEFVNTVKDQVRNRQKRVSNKINNLANVHGCDDECTFMGKNFSTIQSVVKNHESLTLKQMFDVTAQLVNN